MATTIYRTRTAFGSTRISTSPPPWLPWVLPGTGYTDAEDIGQYDTAGEAANAIPAADYAATTQYVFYNRDTTDVEYLSAYTTPGSQVEYWDIVHALTDENRITPHPVADKYEVAALTALLVNVRGHQHPLA